MHVQALICSWADKMANALFRNTKHEADLWNTPRRAFGIISELIPPDTRYVEPCAGYGHLIKGIRDHRKDLQCMWAADIVARQDYIVERDALTLREEDFDGVDMAITNPPYTWSILSQLIQHLANLVPCWMLLRADFLMTKRAQNLHHLMVGFKPTPKMKWVPGSQHQSAHHNVWCFFDAKREKRTPPFLIPRDYRGEI